MIYLTLLLYALGLPIAALAVMQLDLKKWQVIACSVFWPVISFVVAAGFVHGLYELKACKQ